MLKPSILEKDIYLFKENATSWDVEKVLISTGARKIDIKYGFEYSYLSKKPHTLNTLFHDIWLSLLSSLTVPITEEELVNGNPLYFFNKYWNDCPYIECLEYDLKQILPIRTSDKYLELHLNIDFYSAYLVSTIFPFINEIPEHEKKFYNTVVIENLLSHQIIKYLFKNYKSKVIYLIDSFNVMEKEYEAGKIDVIHTTPHNTYIFIDDLFITFSGNGYDSKYPYLHAVITSKSLFSLMKIMDEFILNNGLILEVL